MQTDAERLLDLGYREHRDLPYRFDTLAHGTPVDARMRRLYREALEEMTRLEWRPATTPALIASRGSGSLAHARSGSRSRRR